MRCQPNQAQGGPLSVIMIRKMQSFILHSLSLSNSFANSLFILSLSYLILFSFPSILYVIFSYFFVLQIRTITSYFIFPTFILSFILNLFPNSVCFEHFSFLLVFIFASYFSIILCSSPYLLAITSFFFHFCFTVFYLIIFRCRLLTFPTSASYSLFMRPFMKVDFGFSNSAFNLPHRLGSQRSTQTHVIV